ncbi:MAG: hypothetical protein Q6354_04065 [Candidatus Brocadiales bacterium]|nr:hypothetical protein [Candidatus Brocadiales bacterium]
MVSLALCIIVTDYTPALNRSGSGPTLDNVHKGVFVTVWLVRGNPYFPHLDLYGVTFYIITLVMPYKSGLHYGYDTPGMSKSQPGSL